MFAGQPRDGNNEHQISAHDLTVEETTARSKPRYFQSDLFQLKEQEEHPETERNFWRQQVRHADNGEEDHDLEALPPTENVERFLGERFVDAVG